jgi:GT2 family glycosyltransferase
MDAAVVIVTKNRKQDLAVVIRSALNQTSQPRILVIDDQSTDGTPEMLRSRFPMIRFVQSDTSRGYVFHRNRAASLIDTEIIFSVDDDAEFSSPRVIEQTLRDFSTSRIGAVAIPYLEPRNDNRVRQSAPDSSHIWVTDRFVGTAYAVRRNIFLQLGGYREHLLHQGEEGDFCLRMLAAGYITRLGRSDPIHHYVSEHRSSERMDFYGRRNDILFACQNVPMPYLPFHLVATAVKGSIYAIRYAQHPTKMFSGILSGLAECFGGDIERKPVDRRVYRLSRELNKRGPVPLESVINRLPAVSTISQ